jgi:diacylglycerol kinase (ATP)
MAKIKKKWLMIANTTSGGYSLPKRWQEFMEAVQASGEKVEFRLTTKGGDATKFAMKGIKDGYRKIIGMGGDGTSNEIVNGIFKQNICPPMDILYTLLPVGTANDWVQMHHISPDFSEFFAMLKGDKIVVQDIGRVEYVKNGESVVHYFANAGGAAYDANVVHAVESGGKRRLPKKLVYAYHIVKCLWDYKAQSVRINLDDRVVEGKYYSINFGINKYSGGKMQVTPHALMDDGFLAVTLIKDIPIWRVLTYLPKLYMGTIATAKDYVDTYHVKEISITPLGGKVYIETDGEFLGETPAKVTILKQALRVLSQTKTALAV